MRQLTAAIAAGVFLTGLATATATVQDAPTVPAAEPAAPEVAKGDPAAFTAADRSPETLMAGLAQLVKTRAAYRAAPALTEGIVISVNSPMGEQKTMVDSQWGVNGAFDITVDGRMRMLAFGNTFYMLMPADETRYLSQEIADGDAMGVIAGATGGGGLPDPAIPFRLGKADVKAEEIPAMLGLGAMTNPKLAGFRSSATGMQALLEGEGGKAVVSMNSKTNLIDRIDLMVTPPGAPPEFKIEVAFTIKNELLKALKTPIAFDTTGKTKVDSPDGLGPQPLEAGAMAPDFELKTLEGETVKLSSLRGQVVVLDFWATWCGPCKRGLPVLNQVVQWANEADMPIKFYGVNVWEQGEVAAKLAVAKGFWDPQNFSFSSLIDEDDAVVAKYGVTGIPTSFIIGRDGKVEVVHQGFDPSMVEVMKEELKAAVAEKG
ncbi:MAG: TlpA disulfide reductase family protein [Planctomycetota bacterium]|nr:TlpA disulfide reductase family protein [Planctomycetota bacterium]